MKKLLLGLLVFSCFFLQTTEGYTAFDDTKPAQTQTVSAGMQSTRDNFEAISGTDGSLPALQVDNVNINGNTISSTAGTDLIITPLAGQQIVLDGTIVIDAGVVTGATSITSTGFTGALTGSSTSCVGQADTVATITGLAPDTQNTYARTQYLIPYASSTTAFGEIAIGTDGQVLTSGGAGVAPSFEAAGTSLGDNVITVGTANADYTSIDTALNNADAGDVILVAPGTYTEAITYDDDNVTIRATGSKEDTTITQAAATVVNFSTKEGCVLDGFTVSLTAADGTADKTITGANDHATTYNIIKNCDITYASATALNPATVIDITDGNWEIRDCNITNTNTVASGGALPKGIHIVSTGGTIDIIHCKFDINVTTDTGGYSIGIENNSTAVVNIWDCDFDIDAVHATTIYSAGLLNQTTAGTFNVYNSKIAVDCSSTGLTYGVWQRITGGTINSYNSIYKSTNTDADGTWATTVSGGTLNSYGDQILDGSLSNAGTANLYDTNEKGIITNAKNSGARAYLDTSAQTISTGSFVKVAFNAETYDIQGEFDSSSNNRFTATVAGYYQITIQVEWASPEADKRFILAIHRDGAAVTWRDEVSPSATTPFGMAISDTIYVAANSYIEGFVRNYASGDETISASAVTTFISINKIR